MPRPTVEVRRAGVDDVDDILALWASGREELARSGRQIAAPAQVRPRLAEAIAGGGVEAAVARWDDRPAGFVLFRLAPMTLLTDSPALHLEQLYVRPEARRHGIARALLNGAVSRGERGGAEQVVSNVMPWARDTHRFFARLGFTPVTVRRAAPIATLRRRLAVEPSRGALEDLLSRRRSLRARARAGAAADPPTGELLAVVPVPGRDARPDPPAARIPPAGPCAGGAAEGPDPAQEPDAAETVELHLRDHAAP